jgi:hypothetical protein
LKGRKTFFSEERNQETFANAVADPSCGAKAVIYKCRLLLFFRTDDLSYFPWPLDLAPRLAMQPANFLAG